MAIRKTTSNKKPITGKSAGRKKVIGVKNSKFAKKTNDEVEELKCIISIGLRRSQPVKSIVEDIKGRGLSLALSTVYDYIKDIRAEWRKQMSESYETHVATQNAKLDMMECELWEAWERSKKQKKKDTVNTEKGVIVSRMEESESSVGDIKIMQQLERLWIRRNDLLGITSSTINIQNNIQNIDTVNAQTNIAAPEPDKVEFHPISEAFMGNFVIQVSDRQKP